MFSRSEYWVGLAAIVALSVAVWGYKRMTDEQRRQVFNV
jgi:hypothetical protein